MSKYIIESPRDGLVVALSGGKVVFVAKGILTPRYFKSLESAETALITLRKYYNLHSGFQVRGGKS